MARTPRSRFALLVALCALAAAVIAPSPAAAATGCDGQTLTQPFARWLDWFSYARVPGGSFESGAAAWTRTGRAKVVSGNEPWYVAGPGASSLSIPAGSSATSPGFCAGFSYPTFRLFARSTSLLSAATIDVLYRDASGILRSAPLVNPTLGGGWAPTLALPTLSGLPLLTGSKLSLRVTAVLGGVQIDDVYVDPWSRS